MKKHKGLTMRQREILNGYSFIGLWLFGTIAIFGRGLVQAIHFSLNRVTIAGEAGYTLTPVGLGNYRNIFLQDATFNRLLTESLITMFTNAPFIIFFSLFVALMLNRRFRLRGLARMVFFLPVLMTAGAITGTLDAMMNMIAGGAGNTAAGSQAYAQSGSVIIGFNTELLFITLLEFGMPETVVVYIVRAIAQVHSIINASGVQIIIFLAGLQSIPPSLYEVSKIEGATAYEAFWKITFPIISPLILTNFIYTIVDGYNNSPVFEAARETAFLNLNFGIASAMSLATSAIILILLLISGYAVSRYVVYMS
jgi:ABC-type sugar transport system permease subunit